MLQPLLRPAACAANDRLRGAAPLAPPAPPVLDLDFVGRPSLQYPGLPPISFSRGSTATRVNAAGLIETVAADVPRFDHDPLTGARLGLLIEEARTNSLPYSQDGSGWIESGSTYSAGAAVAPDGTMTAIKIVESGSTGTHRALGPFTSGSAGPWTLSAFLKAGERRYAWLRSYDSASENGAWFDVQTGAILSADAGVTASIESVGNGWYRCAATWSFNVFGGSSCSVYMSLDGTNPSYTGDGSSGLHVWGVQAEQGAFPTSYITTMGAAATRTADVCTIDDLAPWFSATEGTVFAEVDLIVASSAAVQTYVSITDNATSDNAVNLLRNANVTLRAAVRSGAALSAGFNSSVAPTSGVQKLAVAYRTNDFAGAINSETVQTDASGAVPIAPTSLYIGTSGTESYANAHIRRVSYWPRRMPNSVLQALTR